jgi:hypothetical protein
LLAIAPGDIKFPVRESLKPKAPDATENIPSGKIRTAADVGAWVRYARKRSGATLADAAALGNVGIRFLLELEHGKSTASLGKVLQVLERLGLELEIRPRRRRP